ncbi:hypothetical protein EPA93_19150 [Ktedonosporobacter rubrisoli]|uniref:Single-stranded DNA-binding protein n=1 Tax=Ktedonosporobacter rubrisoli TaxID=2509675 RepID=A0A4P6JRC0_KTERU|nr:single-stranded DNA-binding protein [Ktedonosporobacter rubrisoli]QBD77997.1 hypothetical protein EPA93_19150 [Ktedonosporobacter rubrisoli]
MSQAPFTRNEVILMGRVGQTPQLTTTQTGKTLLRFLLLVEQGTKKPLLRLSIVCWEEIAQQARAEVTKDRLVQVKGYLTQRSYQGQTYIDVVAESLEVVLYPDEVAGIFLPPRYDPSSEPF